MAYITNDGARLIERAKTEGKSIVFGSVRMNTTYKSDPTSLVQKSDEWFGANHGSVVGCISHVSVDGVSEVCDSKLAVQCNDNSESWKSIGIYAHLDGEEGEELFACESIENGEYKDVTIVELPVTLDGVVADFGLSEGGSGGGGGGEVPANMMTTDTEQMGLSGRKQWFYEQFYGSGSIDNPKRNDQKTSSIVSIGCYEGNYQEDLIRVNSYPQYYNGEEWLSGSGSEASLTARGSLRLNSGDTYDDVGHAFLNGESLTITPNDVQYRNQTDETFSATWANIISVAHNNIISGRASVQDDKGTLTVFRTPINPNSVVKTDGLTYTFDSSGYLSRVYCNYSKVATKVATIGVVVRDAGNHVVENGRVSGVSMDAETPLTFQSPIQLAAGYTITYQAIFSPLI